MGQIFVK